MSSATFSQKSFQPIPPEKGSFPLDHEGQCKKSAYRYMFCLSVNNGDNSKCRQQIKEYLDCRMQNDLMAKEEWEKLGLANVENSINNNKKTQ